ncbi:MAG: tetratricopeptide repeat protein [bacterium]
MSKFCFSCILILITLNFVHSSVELNTARIAYYNERDYERAKAACLKGIEKGEVNFELHGILGGCEIGLGHWKDAALALAKAFSIDSLKTHDWIHKKGGESYYYQGFFFSARELFDDQQYDKALTNIYYSRILKPKDAAPLILKGVILYKIGNIIEANKAYHEALDLDPYNPDVNYFIGKSLFEAKDFEGSIAYFNNAVKHYRIAFNLASLILFSNAADTSKTLRHTVNRLWFEEKFKELDLLVKDSLELEGGFDAHKINIEKFYKATDDLGRSHYYIGMAYYYIKNDSLALYHLMQTLVIKPDDIDALFFAGEILVNTQAYKEAVEYFERATQIKDDDLYAWFYLGVSYMKLKNYKKAIDAFENKILNIDPSHVHSMQNLAFIYREIGNNQKSFEYLQQVEKLNE